MSVGGGLSEGTLAATDGQLLVTALEQVELTFGANDDGTLDVVANGFVDPRGWAISKDAVESLEVHGSSGDDLIDLGSISAENFPQLVSVTVFGHESNDTICGSHLNDVIIGGEGDDLLTGKSGELVGLPHA